MTSSPRGTAVREGAAATPSTDGGPGSFHDTSWIPWAVSPRSVPADADTGDPAFFFNRELSWIDFNWRVLYQALDGRNPLLERVRFLSITAGNLDEFVRKRVGGLKRQKAAGVTQLSPDGRTPAEQLALVRAAARALHRKMTATWEDTLRPALRERAGIRVVDWEDLSGDQQRRLGDYFRRSIFPILTPLAVEPGHPFPFISNLSLSLAVVLHHPARDTTHYARVKIPTAHLRWIPLEEDGRHVVPVEQVVVRHVHELFRGMEVGSAHLFRVTRNADLRRNEEEADDLLKMISEELRERRFAPVVRLEVERAMPQSVRELLQRELALDSEDVFEADGTLDLTDLEKLAELDGPRHRYPEWEPVVPAPLAHEGESEDVPDTFAVLRSRDLLVHHPYDSFAATVQRFIEEAASDERVLAIKQTLYRTSENSPIVRALAAAAESGKQVACLVEVTARFVEEENIGWGQLLENAGVDVTYGLVGLKTHAKVTMVVRDEPDGIRTYCHIGTGNYHSRTARLYTDIGLLTSDPDIGVDVVNLFHYLTGYAPEQEYRRLLVAPRQLRESFLELIRREIDHRRTGGEGRIVAKMNAIDDVAIIRELYRASREGVRVDLIVRGLCRLRPSLPGVSDNIRVISIIGRFLEHDRIFCFRNGGDPEIYTGSADWRRRNLEDRVEAIVRIDDPDLHRRLEAVLEAALADNRLAWELRPDGRYRLRSPAEGEESRSFHETLMRWAVRRRERAEPPWDISPAPDR